MLKTLLEAFALISTWEVIIAMFAASVYGLVIGSLPGLSATMATALLVPVTFYLSPIAAIATTTATTIGLAIRTARYDQAAARRRAAVTPSRLSHRMRASRTADGRERT